MHGELVRRPDLGWDNLRQAYRQHWARLRAQSVQRPIRNDNQFYVFREEVKEEEKEEVKGQVD